MGPPTRKDNRYYLNQTVKLINPIGRSEGDADADRAGSARKSYREPVTDRSSEQSVLSHLDRLGIAHEVLDCNPEFADTAAFCAQYDVPLSHSANAILVKSRRGERRFGLVVVAADCKLQNRALRTLLETSKVSFASADETREITGMLIGGVSVFGLPDDLPVWIDSRVMDVPWAVVGGGSRSIKIRLAPEDLTRLPTARVVEGLAAVVE